MNSVAIEFINSKISENSFDFVKECDNKFKSELSGITYSLADLSSDVPIILLSGPSGSGKTTTAQIIENMLNKLGHTTYVLSLDNYFHPLSSEQITLKSKNKLDLECPERIDCKFLHSQLTDLINGKSVELPRYNFNTDKREKLGITIERKKGEIILLEGIHALNPEVTGINANYTEKIYVSVRTRLQSKDGNILHPKYIRLIRRVLRDRAYRSRQISETVSNFNSVELGEEKYIMPFKHFADFDIDTFFPYEMSVYKSILDSDLTVFNQLSETSGTIPFLNELINLPESAIMPEALIREFVGSSIFRA